MKRSLDRLFSDDKVLCRLTFLLVVLALLGVDLPRALQLVGFEDAKAAEPKTVALEWKEAGPGRACQPVFQDGTGWRLACRSTDTP